MEQSRSYRPITIQLLALPAFIPCVLMFALPRYEIQAGGRTVDLPRTVDG